MSLRRGTSKVVKWKGYYYIVPKWWTATEMIASEKRVEELNARSN